MNAIRRKEDTAPAPQVSLSHDSLSHEPDQPLRPDPVAHAEILVLTYGLQSAAWIAESNLATARRSDVPYWARVLQTVKDLRGPRRGS